jgi:hypothetical protein
VCVCAFVPTHEYVRGEEGGEEFTVAVCVLCVPVCARVRSHRRTCAGGGLGGVRGTESGMGEKILNAVSLDAGVRCSMARRWAMIGWRSGSVMGGATGQPG